MMLLPGTFFAVLPVWENVRLKSLRSFIAAGAGFICVMSAGVIISRIFIIHRSFVMLLLLSVLFTAYFVLIDAGRGQKLFCLFSSVMLCAFCRIYTLFLMAPYEVDNELWQTSGLFSVKSGIIFLIVAVLTGAMFFKTLRIKIPVLMNQKYFASLWDFMFIIPAMIAVFMWWAVPIHPDFAMVGKLRPAALIILLLVMMMILLLCHVFWRTTEIFTKGAELQQENTLLTMESKRYHELRTYMDETRALRHDFRQHILVITQLAGSGNYDGLTKYLEKFAEAKELEYTGYCGNAAVDAVASYYTSYAEGHGIAIEWRLNISREIPVNETEYCALLGNLTENAIEAVKGLPEDSRWVKVISSCLSEAIVGISVDNPYSGKIEIGRDGLPVVGKEGHGIGLTSVRSTVRRYNGSMNISTKNNIFSVDIILHRMR